MGTGTLGPRGWRGHRGTFWGAARPGTRHSPPGLSPTGPWWQGEPPSSVGWPRAGTAPGARGGQRGEDAARASTRHKHKHLGTRAPGRTHPHARGHAHSVPTGAPCVRSYPQPHYVQRPRTLGGATWVVARAPGVPDSLAWAVGEPSMVLRGSRKDWPPAAASKRYRRRWEGGGSPLAPSHLGTFCPRAVLVEQDALARPGGFQSVFQLQPRGRSSRFLGWGGRDPSHPEAPLPASTALPVPEPRGSRRDAGRRGGDRLRGSRVLSPGKDVPAPLAPSRAPRATRRRGAVSRMVPVPCPMCHAATVHL